MEINFATIMETIRELKEDENLQRTKATLNNLGKRKQIISKDSN